MFLPCANNTIFFIKLNFFFIQYSAGPSYSTTTTDMSSLLIDSNSVSHKRSSGRKKQNISEELMKKRAKNAEAARRSRARRDERMKKLEQEIVELSIKNNELKTRIIVLEVEKKGLEERSTDKNNRITVLENQMTETYQTL